MRGVAFLGIVTTTGCFQTVHRPSCEEHATDVADDEQTPEGKASDLLANVAGDGTADGTLLSDGSTVAVTWSVARGVGSARWVEEDVIDELVSREFGFGQTDLAIFVICDDHLEAPVTLEVASEGGEVDVAVDTVVESLADVTSAGWDIYGEGAFGSAVFPDLPNADPADFTDKVAYADLAGLGSSEVEVSGFAGWAGTQETDTAVSRSSNNVVEFSAGAELPP